jgi:hypothetical protein
MKYRKLFRKKAKVDKENDEWQPEISNHPKPVIHVSVVSAKNKIGILCVFFLKQLF